MSGQAVLIALGTIVGAIITGLLTLRRDSSDAAMRLIDAMQKQIEEQAARIEKLERLTQERLDTIERLTSDIAEARRERDDATRRLEHAEAEIVELRAQVDELSRRTGEA